MKDQLFGIKYVLFGRHAVNPDVNRDCELVALPPCAQHVAPSDILSYYGEMRRYVEHEDELINSRLTWSLTIHGFLFAGFGVVLGKYVDFTVDFYKSWPELAAKLHDSQMLLQSSQHTAQALSWALVVTAVIGILVSVISQFAIVAGLNAIQHVNAAAHQAGRLRILRPPLAPALPPLPSRPAVAQGDLSLPRITSGGALDGKATAGARFYHLLPLVIFLAWLALLCVAMVILVRPLNGYPQAEPASSELKVRTGRQAYDSARTKIPWNMLITKVAKVEPVHGIDPSKPSLTTWHVEFELRPKSSSACKKGSLNCSPRTLDVFVDGNSGEPIVAIH